MDFKYKLGDSVKCKITGFTGVVYSRTQWLNGCITYGIKSTELDKEGKPLDSVGFDEPQLQLVEKESKKVGKATGGPDRIIPTIR
jgi:hypothetical protein